jgi:uncharacterized transporter YbjL
MPYESSRVHREIEIAISHENSYPIANMLRAIAGILLVSLTSP